MYNRSDYSLEWKYHEAAEQLIFSLRAEADDEEFLTGVAFGKRGVPLFCAFVSFFLLQLLTLK